MLFLGMCLGLMVALDRTVPRSLEGWTNEALQASLRVPLNGAIYTAGITTYLWMKARL